MGFVAVTIGCADGSRSTPASDTEAVGDTVIVTSARPAQPDTLLPTETARYGRGEGPIEEMFRAVRAFAVGPDGTVFVHDADDGIRAFSVDGSFSHRVAGSGEGPGEVGYLMGMDASADGFLAVVDLGNERVSVFGPDGSVDVVRRPTMRPRYGDGAIVYTDGGSLWLGVHPLSPPAGGVTHPRPAFVRLGEAGTVTDTVFTPADAAHECTTLSMAEFRAGFWEDRREPFVPKTTWALGRDGSLAVGCPAFYSLDLHRPGRPVLRIRKSPWQPLRTVPDAREGLAPQSGLPRLPATRPAYARIILPSDGRIWVWPNQPSQLVPVPPDMVERFGRTASWRIANGGAFDVFDAEGRWLAVVRLPAEVRFSGFPTEPGLLIRGDTLWAVASDALGVQTIVRYRIDGLQR